MASIYRPDPDDSDIVFNLPSAEDSYEEPENIKDAEGEDSDSDEAPCDVPFSQSKDEALSLQKLERTTRLEIKEAIKSKKRKTEAMLNLQKEQKAQKLQLLTTKRLPDDILDNISSSTKHALKDKQSSLKIIRKMKSSHKRAQKTLFSDLPVEGPTKFQVAVLGSKKWRKRFLVPAASQVNSFREVALNKGIKRQATNKVSQEKWKQQVSGKSQLVGT